MRWGQKKYFSIGMSLIKVRTIGSITEKVTFIIYSCRNFTSKIKRSGNFPSLRLNYTTLTLESNQLWLQDVMWIDVTAFLGLKVWDITVVQLPFTSVSTFQVYSFFQTCFPKTINGQKLKLAQIFEMECC